MTRDEVFSGANGIESVFQRKLTTSKPPFR